MKYLALILALAVAGCETTNGTPGTGQTSPAAKVEAILMVVQRWQDEGLIKPFEVSEKRLRRMALACDAAFIASAGNPDAEAVYARFEGVCDQVRDAWAESQAAPAS